jgi:hypothetical protein
VVEPPLPRKLCSDPTGGPQFGEPAPTPDPTKFTVKHGSDSTAYKVLDSEAGTLKPRAFPIVTGVPEPVVNLADALDAQGAEIEAEIRKAGQLVFHSVGDTGNTRGPRYMDEVADKMLADFDDADPCSVPSFYLHLGDVIYSFGEAQYYYDRFYDPFAIIPRPYSPSPATTTAWWHRSPPWRVWPRLSRTSVRPAILRIALRNRVSWRAQAQLQLGVYYTLEAPFVRILALYSNCLEDPGVISTQNGQFPYLTDTQLEFLAAALARVKSENYSGALLIAVHHPPYVAAATTNTDNSGRHGTSPEILAEIDAVCEKAGVWPHAFLSGHAPQVSPLPVRRANARLRFW